MVQGYRSAGGAIAPPESDDRVKPTLRWRFAIWLSERSFIAWLSSPKVVDRLPAVPRRLLRSLSIDPPVGPRSLAIPPLPPALATVPGIVRDPVQEASAFAESELPVWNAKFETAAGYIQRRNWIGRFVIWGERLRANQKTADFRSNPNPDRVSLSRDELTRRVKERAAQIGLSAVGIAPYNPLYTFAPYKEKAQGGTMIVCALEQSLAATQAIPSVKSEMAHFVTYMREDGMVQKLAEYIESLGFHAIPGGAGGYANAIYYGVEAGLGQLGLNGQLLTPFAGSRCRLMLIQTDMPLVFDRPVDYGIPAICDACQVCVRRCPSGAITNKRQWHRGVLKAKIKTERCVPMVAQLNGCAVCMKVCPVQRYGLPAVLEEFASTGRILGKGSDELEGYVWPVDGKRYGPGEKPRDAVSDALLQPIDFRWELDAATSGQRSPVVPDV
jgi:epoxyqueuosine reductase